MAFLFAVWPMRLWLLQLAKQENKITAHAHNAAAMLCLISKLDHIAPEESPSKAPNPYKIKPKNFWSRPLVRSLPTHPYPQEHCPLQAPVKTVIWRMLCSPHPSNFCVCMWVFVLGWANKFLFILQVSAQELHSIIPIHSYILIPTHKCVMFTGYREIEIT